MYKIKEKPEDFVVEEQIILNLDKQGKYAYFLLKKRDFTTQKAIAYIAKFFHIRLKDVGFAGSKDRRAVTKQTISIYDPKRKANSFSASKFMLDGIELEYIGRGINPISLGDLERNYFEITVKNISRKFENFNKKKPTTIINYFDEQRFSKNNISIGRNIITGNFEAAAKILSDEINVNNYLKKKPTDFIGAIKQIPFKIRQMFIHAYQSWIWNETAAKYLKKNYETIESTYNFGVFLFPTKHIETNISIPIVGFGTEYDNSEIKQIIKEILNSEGISESNFVIRSIPELSSEGNLRMLSVELSNFSLEQINDKEIKLKFFLPKGSYATIAIRQVLQ